MQGRKEKRRKRRKEGRENFVSTKKGQKEGKKSSNLVRKQKRKDGSEGWRQRIETV